jgi:hypothetical protein
MNTLEIRLGKRKTLAKKTKTKKKRNKEQLRKNEEAEEEEDKRSAEQPSIQPTNQQTMCFLGKTQQHTQIAPSIQTLPSTLYYVREERST